jgi:hypothetical protein
VHPLVGDEPARGFLSFRQTKHPLPYWARIRWKEREMDWTKESLKNIQSQVGKRQYEIMRDGFNIKDARDLAADEVGKTFEPPLPGPELQRQIGYWLNKLYKETRDANRQANKPPAGNDPIDADTAYSGTDLYRSWCKVNNHVTTDAELANFTGYSNALFSQARAELKTKGYVFEKNDHGWNIVQPAQPEQPEPIKKQLSKQEINFLTELLKKFS